MGITTSLDEELPTKIIFLDIDGVLNNDQSASTLLPYPIENNLLKILKRIVVATGAVIVLSSNWRYRMDNRNRVQNALGSVEISPFISCIPNFGNNRTDEIIYWIQNNTDFSDNSIQLAPIEHTTEQTPDHLPPSLCKVAKRLHTTHWIAIDDMNLKKKGSNTAHIANHFVHVNGTIGLTEKDADLAIRLLQ